MKRTFLIFCFSFFFSFSQEKASTYFDAQLFRGNIIKHTEDVGHLISGHPDGFLVSYNWKTFGKKEWEQAKITVKELMEKGYKVCIQPVGTTSYSDEKLIKLIKSFNRITFQ